MADNKTTIAVEVEVQGVEQSIESIKDLKNAIKAAKDEQVKMASAFGDGSDEYIKASKKLADLKDKVEDLNDATNSVKGTGIESLSSSFGMLGEGIGNLDLDKVKTGFKGIGAAMSAMPMFLIIEGVKLLWENFDKVKEVVQNLIPSLKEQFNITKELNTANVEGAKNAVVERNNLDNLYKASTDQTKSIDERKKAQIKLQETYPLTFKNFSDEDFALGKAKKGYDELSKSILDSAMLKAKQSLLDKEAIAFAEGEQQRLNEITEAREKLTTASKKQNVSIDIESKSRQVLASDYQVQKEKIDELIKANEAEAEAFRKKNANILGDLAKHQDGADKLEAERAAAKKVETKKNDDGAAAAAKAKREAQRAADLKYMQEIQDAFIKNIEDQDKRLIAQSLLNRQRRDADIQSSVASEAVKNQMLKLSEKTFQDEMQKIYDDKTAKELKAEEDRLASIGAMQDAQMKSYTDKANAASLAQAEKEKALEKAKQDEIVKIIEDSLGTAQNLSNIFFDYKKSKAEKGSKEEMELAKKQFNVNKALQLGFALMDSYKAVTASLAQAPLAIGPAPNPAGIASLAFAITTSAANIAKIASAKFESGGGATGGGGAAPMPSIPAPPTIATSNNNTNQTTSFDENGKNLEFKQPQINVTATVGVDEIASKSNRVSVLENQSTF